MRSFIEKISDEFLIEAESSPRMLEDLAAMEKYMAESYAGRTFIELLQNADDAFASQLAVFMFENDLIIANNGRPFNQDDIISICRSGNSNKQRGANIGYRGIGFKSTTRISKEIIIYSDNVFFTFSKSICAKMLCTDEEKVPAVRIPFIVDESALNEKLFKSIEEYEGRGFTTFFIFQDPDISKINEEFENFNESWLLFLNSVKKVSIDCRDFSKEYEVIRHGGIDNNYFVEITNKHVFWYIVKSDDTCFAFQYDKLKGIVPCAVEEAVFHCFLPTIDKTGYLFKINADFSTDPSRKHIIADDITLILMKKLQSLLSDTIEKVAKGKDVRLLQMISLLNHRTTLNPIVMQFEKGLSKNLKACEWVETNEGEFSKPDDIEIFPKWLDHQERVTVMQVDPALKKKTVQEEWLCFMEDVEDLFINLGAGETDIKRIIILAAQKEKASKLSDELIAKLFVYGNRLLSYEKDILNQIYVPTISGHFKICEVNKSETLSKRFVEAIQDISTEKEIENLIEKYPEFKFLQRKKKSTTKLVLGLDPEKIKNNAAITKWKTPVQNCITLEILSGFSAKKAEHKTKGYSVVSKSNEGAQFYIAVKTVNMIGDPFSLSEDEYAAAQKFGEHYKICLFAVGSDEIEYHIIKNPFSVLSVQRIVKEWEWKCNQYLNDQSPLGETSQYEESKVSTTLITNFDEMNGIEFEKFCAELLLKNGYENVITTAASGDQGIDIIAYKDLIKYGIQCKCYSTDVGNGAVQEAYAGKKYYKCDIGIVMTNQRFTVSAKKLAESNGIILWDRDILLKFIKQV